MKDNIEKKIIGRLEYVDIPDFDLFKIKAKIDTGARGNAVDVSYVTEFEKDGRTYIKFIFLNENRLDFKNKEYETDQFKKVKITSAFGHVQERYLIYTTIILKGEKFSVKLGLSNRKGLPNPVLLGRKILKPFLVDVTKKFTDK